MDFWGWRLYASLKQMLSRKFQRYGSYNYLETSWKCLWQLSSAFMLHNFAFNINTVILLKYPLGCRTLRIILTQLVQSWKKKATQSIYYDPKQKKESRWCDQLNYESVSFLHTFFFLHTLFKRKTLFSSMSMIHSGIASSHLSRLPESGEGNFAQLH